MKDTKRTLTTDIQNKNINLSWVFTKVNDESYLEFGDTNWEAFILRDPI